MPRLSERTHRLICRLSVLVLCAAPTLGVATWIIAHHLPSQRTTWEQRLAVRLDAQVEIKAVAQPQPGTTRLIGLTVREPGQAEPLLQVEQVDIRRYRNVWYVQGVRGELRPESRPLQKLLARCAAPHVHSDDPLVQVSMEQVAMAGGSAMPMRNLVVRHDPRGSLNVSALLGDNAETPCHLEITRQPDSSLRVKLDTAGGNLPAAIATWLLPGAATLGADASYIGTADCVVSDQGISGQVAGVIQQIDLRTLTEQCLPADRRITGKADLALHAVGFQQGRLKLADVSLHGRSGQIPSTWLEALVHELNVQWPTATDHGQPQPASEDTHYQEMAFRIVLQPHQVRVAGQCAGAAPGTMMLDRNGQVVLSTHLSQPQPVTALARLLSPSTRDWVPATAEALAVLKHLPTSGQNTASRSPNKRK